MGNCDTSLRSSSSDCTINTASETDLTLDTRFCARAGSFCRITIALCIWQLLPPANHANTLTAVNSPGGSHVTGCAPGRGHVTLQGVIHHHAIGIEAPAKGADGSLHALDPAARQAVTITLVVQRNHFVPERAVQILPVARVVDAHVSVRSPRPDGESIHAVVRLGPPAIENG